MSPRTEKQYEAIRQERRESIMQAALELFAEDGFENTSIKQIAKKADISKGLIYNYFDSKEQLLEELIKQVMAMIPELFDPPENLSPREQLKLLLDTFAEELRKNVTFWKFYSQLGVQLMRYPEILEKFEPETKEYINRITHLMADLGYEESAAAGLRFMALLDGIALHFLFFDEYPLEKILDNVFKSYTSHE